jgi:signal transduction histidine kinase
MLAKVIALARTLLRPDTVRAAVAAFGLAAGTTWATQADVVTLDEALVVRSEARAFPAGEESQRIALPDESWAGRARPPGALWYRLRFEPPGARQAGEPLGILIARACSRIEAWVNARLVHTESSPDPARPGDCHRPRLLTVPSGVLRAEGNVLDIRLEGPPLQQVASRHRAGGLSVVRIGAPAQLQALQSSMALRHQTLPLLLATGMLVLGAFTLVVGWLNTRKSYLLYLGALAIGWATLQAGVPLGFFGFSALQIEWLTCALAPLVTAFAVLFLMRYAGLRHRMLEAALLSQCVVVPASLTLAGANRLFLVASSWYLVLALEIVIAAGASLWVAWRLQRREFWVMLGLLAMIAAGVGSDFAAQYRWLSPAAWPALELLAPAAFAALALRLLYLEVRALRVFDTETRAIIEKRVAEATQEAERNYAALAELRVEQVTERERKRIAADLHDDLGAKLLTIVHTSDSERISSLAREALEEMRLSVRGLTGKPVRLADALGDWRAEVVSRLSQANIGAEWKGPTEETPQTLPARAYVQTTRILREAVSNIIKHSNAARCTVSGMIQDGDFVLTIQDNGAGIPMELDGKLDRGHGMASMKQRAKQLHGQCLVESGPGFGTVIRLTIPL